MLQIESLTFKENTPAVQIVIYTELLFFAQQCAVLNDE